MCLSVCDVSQQPYALIWLFSRESSMFLFTKPINKQRALLLQKQQAVLLNDTRCFSFAAFYSTVCQSKGSVRTNLFTLTKHLSISSIAADCLVVLVTLFLCFPTSSFIFRSFQIMTCAAYSLYIVVSFLFL